MAGTVFTVRIILADGAEAILDGGGQRAVGHLGY
jgi:hypothetical protein